MVILLGWRGLARMQRQLGLSRGSLLCTSVPRPLKSGTLGTLLTQSGLRPWSTSAHFPDVCSSFRSVGACGRRSVLKAALWGSASAIIGGGPAARPTLASADPFVFGIEQRVASPAL